MIRVYISSILNVFFKWTINSERDVFLKFRKLVINKETLFFGKDFG